MLDKIKKNYYLLIITFLFIYFFFNLLDGNRGLISNLEKQEIYRELKLKENDLIIICDVGAYGISLSSNYNLRPKPAEILIKKSKASVISKRQKLIEII